MLLICFGLSVGVGRTANRFELLQAAVLQSPSDVLAAVLLASLSGCRVIILCFDSQKAIA